MAAPVGVIRSPSMPSSTKVMPSSNSAVAGAGIGNIPCAVFTVPRPRGSALHELNCEVYKRFRRDGIEIPYAKQDVYVKELPTGTPERSPDHQ